MPLAPGEFIDRLERLKDRPARWILFGVILLGAVFLMRPSLNSDGSFYYGWVRSLIFDGDVNLYNEAVYYPKGWMFSITQTVNDAGYPYNGFSCGPGILWLPFIGAAHLIALLPFSHSLADGYSAPYIAALGVAGLLTGLVGALLLYSLCRRYASPLASLLGTSGIFATSSWMGYVYGDPSFSHAYSVLGVIVFLHALLLARDKRTFPVWFLAGTALGAAMLMRWQNALFGAVAAAFLLERAMILQSDPEAEKPWRLFADAAGMAVGAVLVFSPQFLIWYVGSGKLSPPVSGGFLNWERAITSANVLFDPLHGFFSWSPFLLIVLFLIPVFWKRDRYLCGSLFLVFYLQVYLNGVVLDWWAGGSFGMRRLCNCLPLFALALACAFDSGRRRPFRWGALALALFFASWWNFALAASWFGAALDTLQALDRIALSRVWGFATSYWQAHVVLGRLPVYRGTFSALLYGDFGGFLRTIAYLAIPGLIGAGFVLLISRARERSDRSARRFPALLTAGSLVALAFIINVWIFSSSGRTGRVILPLRGAGGEGLDSVSVTYRHDRPFRGGNLDLALSPGEIASVTLTPESVRPFTRFLVNSFIEGAGGDLEPFQPALKVTLEDSAGRTNTYFVHTGTGTAPSHLSPFERHIPKELALQETRAWRDSPYGWATAREFGAVTLMDEPLAATRVTLTSLLDEDVVRIRGLGLAESGWEEFIVDETRVEQNRQELARVFSEDPWEGQQIIDLGEAANSDYRSNPFIPRSVGERAEFPMLPSGFLDYRDVRFQLRRPYPDTGVWSVMTTACGDGYVAIIPAGNKRYHKIAFAWCGGAIRQPQTTRLADLTLVYEDDTTQVKELHSNQEVYELLYHTPLSKLIWDAHGRLGYWEVETTFPDKRLKTIRLADVNGPDNAGIALFAVTGILTQPEPGNPQADR